MTWHIHLNERSYHTLTKIRVNNFFEHGSKKMLLAHDEYRMMALDFCISKTSHILSNYRNLLPC